jgi:hypothetical protein
VVPRNSEELVMGIESDGFEDLKGEGDVGRFSEFVAWAMGERHDRERELGARPACSKVRMRANPFERFFVLTRAYGIP